MSGCSKKKPQSSAVLEPPNASYTTMKSEAAKTASKPSNNATKKQMTVKQHIIYKFSVVCRAKAYRYNFSYCHTNTQPDTLKDTLQNWCSLIESKQCSIKDNVIKSNEISSNGIESGSTECAIPAAEELGKGLPNIMYDRSVSLLGTSLSQPLAKQVK